MKRKKILKITAVVVAVLFSVLVLFGIVFTIFSSSKNNVASAEEVVSQYPSFDPPQWIIPTTIATFELGTGETDSNIALTTFTKTDNGFSLELIDPVRVYLGYSGLKLGNSSLGGSFSFVVDTSNVLEVRLTFASYNDNKDSGVIVNSESYNVPAGEAFTVTVDTSVDYGFIGVESFKPTGGDCRVYLEKVVFYGYTDYWLGYQHGYNFGYREGGEYGYDVGSSSHSITFYFENNDEDNEFDIPVLINTYSIAVSGDVFQIPTVTAGGYNISLIFIGYDYGSTTSHNTFPKMGDYVNLVYDYYVLVYYFSLTDITQTDGYNDGYNDGYEWGHERGYLEGGYSGYLQGLDEGYTDGYSEGYVVGKRDGLNLGQSLGISNPVSFFFEPVESFLSVKLFGTISVGSVLSVVVFVAVALVFIKMFAGG